MASTRVNQAFAMTQAPPMWKLICKLRWIGLEDEAVRLQLKMRSQSGAEPNGAILTETFDTD